MKAEKWDAVTKNDQQINELKNDSKEFQKLTRPVDVFMTFESEEGYQRALAFEENTKTSSLLNERNLQSFLGQPGGDNEIQIKAASEPSDIIWENRHVTDR